MNQSILSILLSVGLFCLVPLIETHNMTVVDEIAVLGRRLFGSDDDHPPERLSFDKMLNGLRDLQGLIRQARVEQQVDTSKFAEWRRLIVQLFDLHERFTQNCSISAEHRFSELKRSMPEFKEFGENVVSFLETLAKHHYASCVSNLKMSAASTLTEEQRKNLHQLNEMMNQASADERVPGKMTAERAWLMLRYMDGVVFEFMKAHEVADRVNYPEIGHFSNELTRLLEEPCRIVRSYAFKIPVEAIDASRVLEFLAPIDSETLDWLEIYETCVGLDRKMASHFYREYFAWPALYDSSYDTLLKPRVYRMVRRP